ncbi:RNA polymerase sigma-70 factor [Protaetiibacter mangrovi]|uniref:RNA polymerase sigma-70 factor n=1 Tax=Protaetiibacter mangrovi TaxID=2970926 RepID=A0ABT1ZF45_9MICO|nr:RNA polymerase sigma-70 factor [Protaetiibacter mangrovi]MCS0499270.1 RNA polymerase sigma-70 factor [Protaetiibacter mangrovi]TPX04524.1 RNA polymerase sigma-70 factor [Schumannella luteola]
MATDTALTTFENVRPRLFGIAYRMMGTVAEAEDLVQEAWLRWQGVDHDAVREPAAFLATTITRLALTELGSARARRESYVGPWLPEPVDTSADPALGAERGEALSVAMLVLLERLTPAERAVYVLHEAFDYPYRRIAEVLETSEANARQLAARGRAHVAGGRTASVSSAERDRVLAAFLAAAQHGDLEALEAVLAEDVVALSDGGGAVIAARKPVVGRERVARFLLGVVEKFASDLDNVPASCNGDISFVGSRDGETIAVWTLDIGPEGVRGFYNVLNPAKLSRITAVSGLSG